MAEILNVNDLRENPANDRSMDPDAIRVLAESIDKEGFRGTLVAYRDGDRYTLLSGHKRLAALRLCGINRVPVDVVDAPKSLTEEQEIMSRLNIHRSAPEEVRQEVSLMSRAWNTMDADRKKELTAKYRDEFTKYHSSNPKYQEDPDGYISRNFKPKCEYIRHMTGLSDSNTTIKRALKEIAEQENGNPATSVIPKIIGLKDVSRTAKRLQDVLGMYQPDDPTVEMACADTKDMLEILLETIRSAEAD